MEIMVGAKNDSGLKREYNEDSFLVDKELGLFLVADGMGGHNAGEVASRMAVETIRDVMLNSISRENPSQFNNHDPKLSKNGNLLLTAIKDSNKKIHKAGQEHISQVGMGTTVAAVYYTGSRIVIAHVGDSRIYRIRDKRIELLTTDHSLIADQVIRGIITKEEARKSEFKNIITRALGVDEDVEIDIEEQEVMPGDILTICTDGLTDMLEDNEILDIIKMNIDSPQIACEKLVDAANKRGGEDNITVIIVRFVDNEKKSIIKRIFSTFFKKL